MHPSCCVSPSPDARFATAISVRSSRAPISRQLISAYHFARAASSFALHGRDCFDRGTVRPSSRARLLTAWGLRPTCSAMARAVAITILAPEPTIFPRTPRSLSPTSKSKQVGTCLNGGRCPAQRSDKLSYRVGAEEASKRIILVWRPERRFFGARNTASEHDVVQASHRNSQRLRHFRPALRFRRTAHGLDLR